MQEGHFILSSGMHSPIYLQSAIVLSFPKYLKLIAESLVNLIKKTWARIYPTKLLLTCPFVHFRHPDN